MWKKRQSVLYKTLRSLVGSSCARDLIWKCPPEDFVKRLSSEISVSEDDVLRLLADKLGLTFITELEPNSHELLERSGFSAEELRVASCFLQPDDNAIYRVATSRPTAVDLDAFLRRGIPVSICSSNPRVLEKQTQTVSDFSALESLVEMVKGKNSSAVFIGIPSPNCYLFMVDGRRYSGKLADKLVEQVFSCPSEIEAILNVSVDIEPGEHRASISWNCDVSRTRSPIFTENIFTVALVDDDLRYSKVVRNVLDTQGWNVLCFSDANKFLNYLDTEKVLPSLVICDLHLRGESGIDLLLAIKECPEKIPVIVVTSDDSYESEIEVAAVGAEALVRKQSSPRVLVSWCHNVLKRSKEL